MAPWNAPVILATRAIATPLAYGNTVVLKASEQCPRTHAAVAAALHDAGLPAGAINLVIHAAAGRARGRRRADRPPGRPARQLHRLDARRPDRRRRRCAEHLKRCLLELGGKAPQVVLGGRRPRGRGRRRELRRVHELRPDLHVDRADRRRPVGGRGARRAARRAGRALPAGDPRDQGTMIGPVIDDASRERVVELIEDARAKGARCSPAASADGNVVAPTVLAGVTPEMRIYAEESFGPVVDDRARRRRRRGRARRQRHRVRPAAAVFGGTSPPRWPSPRRIESGICHVNGSTVHDEPQMPFGGVKASGWGRFGGTAALEEFTELRWMTVQHGGAPLPDLRRSAPWRSATHRPSAPTTSAACCARRRCCERASDHAAGRLDDAELRAAEDDAIRDVVALQERRRTALGHRRRVPPRVVAHGLHLPARRRSPRRRATSRSSSTTSRATSSSRRPR